MEKRGTPSFSEEVDYFEHSKSGMSPLIATVLLIAFAVAIGAMIMNWSTSLGESTGGPDCSGINMIINPYFCYADNLIKMSVKNTGERIEALTLRISDDNIEQDISLKNSQAIKKEIPYVKNGKAYVALIPNILYNDKIVPCANPILETDDIPACEG